MTNIQKIQRARLDFVRVFCVLILAGALSVSCTRRGGSSSAHAISADQNQAATVQMDGDVTSQSSPVISPKAGDTTINIYIENSGSMNGFINNASSFQDAIQKMMVLLKYYYGEKAIKLNYINTAVHPQQIPANVAIEDFAARMLTPAKFKGTGNVHSTDLNDIVKMVLNGVDDQSLSILISDCIYSIVGSGTTTTLLAGCKNKTMGEFLEKSKEFPDLATTVVKLASHFEGYYWDFKHPSGTASQTLSCSRPYYMCVIGTEANVDVFNDHISVEEMNGYQDKYILSCSDFSEVNYSVLPNTHKMAMFRVRGATPYKTLEKARLHGNLFQFAIAADLSTMPMSSSEKLDVSNYSVIQGEYTINGIYEIDTDHMHPVDRAIVNELNLTHEIVVSTDAYPADITVGINRAVPQWVKSTSSSDDTQINQDTQEQGRTFGLQYFVEGISDAYKEVAQRKDYLTEFKITIKH